MPRNQFGRLERIERGEGISLRAYDHDGSIRLEAYGVPSEEANLRERICNAAEGYFGFAMNQRDRYTEDGWLQQRSFTARNQRSRYTDYVAAARSSRENAAAPGLSRYDVEYYVNRANEYDGLAERQAELLRRDYDAIVEGETVTFPRELAERLGEWNAVAEEQPVEGEAEYAAMDELRLRLDRANRPIAVNEIIWEEDPPTNGTILGYRDELQEDIDSGWVVSVGH